MTNFNPLIKMSLALSRRLSSSQPTVKDKGPSVQHLTIHFIRVDHVFALTGRLGSGESVDLHNVCQRIVTLYNQKGGKEAKNPYKELKGLQVPAGCALTVPQFQFYAYRQNIEIKSKLTKQLEDLGSKSEAIAQHVNYLLFFVRFKGKVHNISSAEVIGLTTGDGWRALQDVYNFLAPFQFACRLLDSNKISNYDERHLIGPKLKSKTTLKKSTKPDNPLDAQMSHIKCGFREDASIFAFECLQNKDNTPKKVQVVIGAGVRICRELSLNDYPQILDLFSQIIHGEKTYCYDPSSEDLREEKDTKEFTFLNYLQPANVAYLPFLDEALDKLLWRAVQGEISLSLDFCHKMSSDYFYSQEFRLTCAELANYEKSWDVPESAQEMVERLKQVPTITICKDFKKFREALKNIHVSYKKGDRFEKAPFRDYLEGEVRLESGDSFWRLHKMWHVVSKEYFSFIQSEFSTVLKQCLVGTGEHGFLPWLSNEEISQKKKALSQSQGEGASSRYDAEGEYNQLYLNKPKWILGDKICPRGIELFDLLHYDERNIYLIQVKQGLGQSTRDVASQTLNAAESVHDDLRHQGSSKSLDEFYKECTEYEGEPNTYRSKAKAKLLKEFPTLESFRAFFRDKKREIHFVYAFVDSAKGVRLLENEKELKLTVDVEELESFCTQNKLLINGVGLHQQLQEQRLIDEESYLTSYFFALNQQRFTEVLTKTLSTKKDRLALHRLLSKHCSDFDSTIAKLELVRLRRNLIKLEFGFKIIQIPRTDYPKDLSVKEGKKEQDFPSRNWIPDFRLDLLKSNFSPDSRPEWEGTTIKVNGEKFRVEQTDTNGACGMHALLGTPNKQGIYYLKNARITFKDSLIVDPAKKPNTAKYIKQLIDAHLKDLLEQRIHRADHREANLVFTEDIYKLFVPNVLAHHEMLEKVSKAKDKIFLELLEIDDEDLLGKILEKVRAHQKYCEKIEDDEELVEKLKQSSKLRLNAFDPILEEIYDLLPEDVRIWEKMDALWEKIDQEEESWLEKQKILIESEEVYNSYLGAIMNPSYYFSDREIRLAAYLFKKSVTIVPHSYLLGQTKLITGGIKNGEPVYIYHEGEHYSHCTKLKVVNKKRKSEESPKKDSPAPAAKSAKKIA